MAIPLVSRSEKVDIRVEPQDIPPIALTLAHYFTRDGKRQYDVRYVVSNIHLSALGEYESQATLAPRPDAVYVFVDDEVCPSISAKKNVTEEWAFKGEKKLERYSKGSPRFVAQCAILSAAYFESPYRVSFHAPPSEFVGILTTESQFELAGVEEDVLVRVKATSVSDWVSFLEHVVATNVRFNTFFLAPQTFYSPIANVLRTPKGHMKLEIGDGGEWQWGKVISASFVNVSPGVVVSGEDLTDDAQNASSAVYLGPTTDAGLSLGIVSAVGTVLRPQSVSGPVSHGGPFQHLMPQQQVWQGATTVGYAPNVLSAAPPLFVTPPLAPPAPLPVPAAVPLAPDPSFEGTDITEEAK